jgi:hypothetical protein
MPKIAPRSEVFTVLANNFRVARDPFAAHPPHGTIVRRSCH